MYLNCDHIKETIFGIGITVIHTTAKLSKRIGKQYDLMQQYVSIRT